MKSNFTLFGFGLLVCFIKRKDLLIPHLRTLNQLAIYNKVRPKDRDLKANLYRTVKIRCPFRQSDPKASLRKSCKVNSEPSDNNISALKRDFVTCQVPRKQFN